MIPTLNMKGEPLGAPHNSTSPTIGIEGAPSSAPQTSYQSHFECQHCKEILTEGTLCEECARCEKILRRLSKSIRIMNDERLVLSYANLRFYSEQNATTLEERYNSLLRRFAANLFDMVSQCKIALRFPDNSEDYGLKEPEQIITSQTPNLSLDKILPVIEETIRPVLNDFKALNDLEFQQVLAQIHAVPSPTTPMTPEQLQEMIKNARTKRQESVFSSLYDPIIKALQAHFKELKIMLEVQHVVTIVTNVISLIAALMVDRWQSGISGAMIAAAVTANVVCLLTTVYSACKIFPSQEILEQLHNLAAYTFKTPENFKMPHIGKPGKEACVSPKELEAALNQSIPTTQQQAGETEDTLLAENTRFIVDNYPTLRAQFSTPTKDPIALAVNGISWLLSIGTIFCLKALCVDIRSAVTHLTFLKYSRELQQHLYKDVQGIGEYCKEYFTKPKEVNFRLYSNRVARIEELLKQTNIDIACNPIELTEYKRIMRTNDDFIATTMQDDGMKSFRQTLSVLNQKMVDRYQSIYELAKSRGLRPVPVALHLWSTIGGVGKSSFVTNCAIPEMHKTVGTPPGSEICLKLSTENKYFPPMGESSQVFHVDEFLCASEKDPVLQHLNGMISETPYFLDSAFEKNQHFSGSVIFLNSNIPGVRLASTETRINDAGATAMWGRLMQFEVVNIKRPLGQAAHEREFQHDPDYKDLRFLSGNYIISNSRIKATVPDYPKEIKDRISKPNDSWVPKAINGKYWFTAEEILEIVRAKYRANRIQYEQSLAKRRATLVSVGQDITQIQLRTNFDPVDFPDTHSWSSLPDSEKITKEYVWKSTIVGKARLLINQKVPWLHDPNTPLNPDESIIQLTSLSNHIINTYSSCITEKILSVKLDESVSLQTAAEILSLAYCAKMNINWNNKFEVIISTNYPQLFVRLDDFKRTWHVPPSSMDMLTKFALPEPPVEEEESELEDDEPEVASQNGADLSFDECKASNLKVVKTPGKVGDCLYESVKLIAKIKDTPAQMRNNIIDTFDLDPKVVAQLKAGTKKKENWPDEYILELLCDFYNFNACIHITESDRSKAWMQITVQKDLPLYHFSFSRPRMHYEAMQTIEQQCLQCLFSPVLEPIKYAKELHPRQALRTLLHGESPANETDVEDEVKAKKEHVTPLVDTEPTILEPGLPSTEIFAVYIYGGSKAGKSYYANMVATQWELITGYHKLTLEKINMDRLGQEQNYSVDEHKRLITMEILRDKPHIIINNDCVWHDNYISLYAACHPKTIIINTSNEFPKFPGKLRRCQLFADYESSLLGTVTTAARGLGITLFEIDDKHIGHLPSGIARRVGIPGSIAFKGDLIEVSAKSNCMIKMKDQKHQVWLHREGRFKDLSGAQLTTLLWQKYNLWLRTIGEIEFVKVTNHASVTQKLGDKYKDADITVWSESFAKLKKMLSSPATVFSSLSNSSVLNSVYIKQTFLHDQNLAITKPDVFLVSVDGEMGLSDLVQQGLAMYKHISHMSSDPAIRIICGKYDIYCYQNKIYVNDSHEIPTIEQWGTDSLVLVNGEHKYVLKQNELWGVIKPNSDFVPTDIPQWVLKYLKQNAERMRKHEMFTELLTFENNARQLVEVIRKSHMTWTEMWKEIMESPYWQVLKIAAGLLGLAAMGITIYSMLNRKPPAPAPEVVVKLDGKYVALEEDSETSDEETELPAQQTHEVKERREARKARNAKKAMNIRAKQRAYRAATGRYKGQQMVRHQPTPYSEAIPTAHDAIAKKVENAIVYVKVTYKQKGSIAYGIAIGGRNIVCPAHYVSRGWDLDDDLLIEVQYTERGTGTFCTVPCEIQVIRRDLELLLLRIPDSVKTWQDFPDITKFVIKDEELESAKAGFLMVHDKESVHRYYCAFNYHLADSETLNVDDILTNSYSVVTWQSHLCETRAGYCGLPYFVKTNSERVWCGIHIAAGSCVAYGANITQETLEILLTTHAQMRVIEEEEDCIIIPPSLSSDDVREDENRDLFPESDWLIKYSDFIGRPVVFNSLFAETDGILDNLSTNMKLPESVRQDSSHIHPLGYVRIFDTGKAYKLKKMKSPFSEIACENGIPCPKRPSVTHVANAPSDLKVSVFQNDGKLAGESVVWAQLVQSNNGFEWTDESTHWYEKGLELLKPSFTNVYGKDQHRPLNTFEVLNGIQYGPYKGHFSGLDRSAAMGLPTSATFKCQLKSAIIGLEEGKNGNMVKTFLNNESAGKVLSYLEECQTSLENGEVPIMPFKASMKAELVAKTKSRVFCAAGFENTFLTNKYFGTFAAAVKKYHRIMHCQVGVDPKGDLAMLWNRFTKIEGENVCVDFKRWDKLTTYEAMLKMGELVIEIILSNLDPKIDKVKYENILKGLLFANIAPTIVVEGVLVRTTRGLPSGSSKTSWLSSLINSGYTAGGLLKFLYDKGNSSIVRPGVFASNDYRKLIDEANYGDDKVIRVAKILIELGFTYSTIKQIFDTLFGTVTTPASKGTSCAETVPMNESEFISRTAVQSDGGVWLNRLKRESIDVLWHWVGTGGSQEENLIQNLDIIMEENLIWGKEHYIQAHKIALSTLPTARVQGLRSYVEHVNHIGSYEAVIEPYMTTLKASIADFSMPAEDTFLKRQEVCESAPEPVLEDTVVKQQETQTASTEEPSILELPTKEVTSSVQEILKESEMLPPKYGESPFPGDMMKTSLYFHLSFVLDVLLKGIDNVVAFVTPDRYRNLLENGTEKVIDGVRVIELREENACIIHVLSLTWQACEVDVSRKMPTVNEVRNKINERKQHLLGNKALNSVVTNGAVQYFLADRGTASAPRKLREVPKTSVKQQSGELKPIPPLDRLIQRVYRQQILPALEHKASLASYQKPKRLTRKQAQTLVRGYPRLTRRQLKNIQQQNDTTGGSQPIGSTAPTMDATAAPAAPSEIVAQLSNQENNGALGFGNAPAVNRLGEGGKMIQLTELIVQNWLQVHGSGLPLISVPVDTPPGTMLLSANMWELMSDAARLYFALHERCIPSLEVMINYIGTPTWAGNILISVTPEKPPTGNAIETDNYLRSYAYEQKPLSSNGTQTIFLERLINNSQTNVAWDPYNGAGSTGPTLNIQLASNYEQALANPNTAFQLQVLSRLGSQASVGGPNWPNINKALLAITSPTPDPGTPDASRPGKPLQALAGLTWPEAMRAIYGQDLQDIPQLILNGSTYEPKEYPDFIQDQIASLVRTTQPSSYDNSFYQEIRLLLFSTSSDYPNFGLPVTRIGQNADEFPVLRPNFQNGTSTGISFFGMINDDGVAYQRRCALHWWQIQTNGGFSKPFLTDFNEYMRSKLFTKSPRGSNVTPQGMTTIYNDQRADKATDIACVVGDFEYTNAEIENIRSNIMHGGFPLELITYLSNLGYSVTYTPTNRTFEIDLGWYTNTSQTQKVNRTLYDHRVYNVRVERDGIVDTFVIVFFRTNAAPIWYSLASGYTRGDQEVIGTFTMGPYSTFEVPNQNNTGSNLPENWRKLEVSWFPQPVNSNTVVPVASTPETTTLFRFLKKNCPSGYNTIVELWNTTVGRRQVALIYNPDLDTAAVAFGNATTVPQHALFSGGTAEQITVRSIQSIGLTNTVPTSDPAVWNTLVTNATDVSTVQQRAQVVSGRWANRKRTMPKSALKELILSTMQERESQLDEYLQRRTQTGTVTRSLRHRRSNAVQQVKSYRYDNHISHAPMQSIRSMTANAPRQIQVGKAASVDRQNGMTLLGMVGGGPLKGALNSQSAAKAGTQTISKEASKSTAQSAKQNGLMSLNQNQVRHEDVFAKQNAKEKMLAEASKHNREATRKQITDLRARKEEINSKIEKSQADHGLGNNSHGVAKWLGQGDAVYEKRTNKVTVNTKSGNVGSGKGVSGTQSVSFGRRKRMNTWQKYATTGRQGLQSLNSAFGSRARPERAVRYSKLNARSQGGVISSGAEGAINAGLASQQQGYNKELMDKYFENMSAQEQQAFLNQVEMLEKQGVLDSKLMKEQYGFDLDLMREQNAANLEKELTLQQNQIEHEKNLSSQEHEQSLEKLKMQQENAAEVTRQNQLSSGHITAGLAGLNSSPSRTMSSGIV